ncbi:MAG: 23S rRNA (adenine(2503)-C(2))-methyltransferase RlmN [Thermoguttaceae bacterium]
MTHPILEFDQTALLELMQELHVPSFRVAQLRNWIFARKKSSFDEMVNLPKTMREMLAEKWKSVWSGREIQHIYSDEGTEKLLIEWEDGERIECVLLRDDRDHRTGCISTQVGCAMKCAFCASGMDGFVRNLTRGELLEQILRLNALLPNTERLTHLVIMGIGEPLLNLDALLSALDDATCSNGLDLSVRRVTISTVGIPTGIRSLAKSVKEGGKGYKLAISLHAPNDILRSQLVPQNRVSGIEPILNAADVYFHETGRRVTYEYTLIAGQNDAPEHARELVTLLKHRTAIVNIIPLNTVAELPFRPPNPGTIQQFVRLLEQGGLQVKVRFKKGDRIAAACGQLRRKQGCTSNMQKTDV